MTETITTSFQLDDLEFYGDITFDYEPEIKPRFSIFPALCQGGTDEEFHIVSVKIKTAHEPVFLSDDAIEKSTFELIDAIKAHKVKQDE